LVERFPEPTRGGATAAGEPLFVGLRAVGPGAAQPPAANPQGAPAAKKARPVKGLITALVAIALVPTAILFVLLWQDAMHHEATLVVKSAARLPDTTGSLPAAPAQAASSLEVALSSPDRVEANAGAAAEFPIAIDATEALPARSIVTITALPHGASFSAGRPFGDSGWSLRPDEIGGLSVQLPAESGAAHLRLELVAGDGSVLAQSETELSVAAAPAEVAAVAPLDDNPFDQAAPAEQPVSVAPQAAEEAPPPPERKPSSPVADATAVKVTKVKVVTIDPPRPTRPHDGAYALGSPADDAQTSSEWMETKTAVDMHAKAEQSSETVKVADGGVKMRVTARDKNWVQVTDPKSSTTGWIYNRFLQPADPPAQ
jgi:hypothetical protein